MKKVIATVIACASSQVAAQDTVPPPPAQPPVNQCAEDPNFKDWDFWLGKWRVTSGPKKGVFAGTNIITKTEQGCLIREEWTNAKGNTGFSMNYYNPVTKQWRQVWVSPPGVEIDYTGGLNDKGEMVLEGTIYYYQSGKIAPYRGTWTLNQDGSVRQLFEEQDKDGKWQLSFDGHYVKESN